MSFCDGTAALSKCYFEGKGPCLLTLCRRGAANAYPTGHQACSWSLSFVNKRPIEGFFSGGRWTLKDWSQSCEGPPKHPGATPTMTIATFELRGGRYAIQRLIQNTDWSEIQCVICFATHAGWWRSLKKAMRRKSVLKGLLCLNWLFYSSLWRWTASCGKKEQKRQCNLSWIISVSFSISVGSESIICFSLFSLIKTSFITFSPSISAPGLQPLFLCFNTLSTFHRHAFTFPPLVSSCQHFQWQHSKAKTTCSLKWKLRVKEWIPQARLSRDA